VDAGGNYARLSAQARIAGLLEAQKADEYGGSRAVRGVSSPGDPNLNAGNEQATARFQQATEDKLQADVLATGVPAPTSTPVDQPWPPRETVADDTATIHQDGDAPQDKPLARDTPPASLTSPMPTADKALEQREKALAEQEKAVAEREAGVQQERDRLDQLLADRRGSAESVDGGEAPDSFDGDGPGSDSYYSKADLVEYGQQHGIDIPSNASRADQLEALKEAGHDKPETPKS
jgi:hypothetical protein